eukprot:TRINITY_DN4853_c0_g1_i1.p1 TRINITY_DN4853_c0_g1~~TRINITY_DN4853_c0_g1_i1.p1  ORF type:complete len:511 (+),score=117.41 TRINITY_DN4853_c0_g1_i1:87-1619(+)
MQHLMQENVVDIKRVNSMEFLNVSNPPTNAELASYQDIPPDSLPPTYKREIRNRIFVNRDLRLDRIKWIGFDMDYTIANYKSPEYESLSYDLMARKLVNMGYPGAIANLKYDPTFPVRGTLLDTQLGHILKIDTYGNITMAVHGRTRLTKQTISELYPSMHVPSQDIGKRYYPYSTLFNLPEACLYADVVSYFESEEFGQKDMRTSFTNLFQDIRMAMDFVHLQGELKQKTLENLPTYLTRNEDMITLFDRMNKTGMKLMLITNSEYYYTNQVMSYLLDGNGRRWNEFFDIVIVAACKPLFFSTGTTLREVNTETGNLKIDADSTLRKGHVYQGGNIKLLESAGVKGNQVLYVGDHIYADIIKSKKTHAWRTLLVIPELEHELEVSAKNQKIYDHLLNLQFMKAEAYRGLDSESTVPPDTSVLRKHIKQTAESLNATYNSYFGSLFGTGAKLSLFSTQVERYADLYSHDWINLLHYPLFYYFTATLHFLPHAERAEKKHLPLDPTGHIIE